MTDKKKPLPPSMRAAAATQKLTKAQLDDLLKIAEAADEGAPKDDADASTDEPAADAASAKKAAPKKKK